MYLCQEGLNEVTGFVKEVETHSLYLDFRGRGTHDNTSLLTPLYLDSHGTFLSIIGSPTLPL